jgi:TolA-binding protein
MSDRSFDSFEQCLLDSATGDGMSPERKRALLAAVASVMATTTPAAAAGAAGAVKAKTAVGAVVAKWLLAVITSAAVVAAGVHLVGRRPQSSTVAMTPVEQAPITQPPAPPPAPEPAPPEVPVVVAAPKPPPASVPARAPASSPTLADELRLIERARAALAAGDVASADRALEAHARTFPSGVFAEEARVLRIDSMIRRGDRARAEPAARAYLSKHPESPHAPRLRALLGEPER